MSSPADEKPVDPAAIGKSVREQALLILYEINEKGAYANLALEKGLKGDRMTLADRNLVTELVNGTVRMQKHLDWVLALFLQGDINKQNRWFLNILRLSIYQLLFMERIPPYACVNEAVNMARRKVNTSMARVTNAVLRRFLREKNQLTYPPLDDPSYLAVYYSHPEWIIVKYLDEYGWELSRNILEYNNQRPGLDFRYNRLKGSRTEIIQKLTDEGVSCTPSPMVPDSIQVNSLPGSISNLDSYRQGMIYIQNQASMLAVPILNPQPGEMVFDLCAGVGGKTTHLAEWMDNTGVILAYDLYPRKLELLSQNAARMGISIIKTQTADVLQLRPDKPAADRILLDVPCTGLGVLNRRSDSRWHKKPEDLAALLDIQQRLLDKAAGMLKSDGLMLYSTCTILKEENQLQITQFLQRNRNYKLEPLPEDITSSVLDHQDREISRQGMLLLTPGKYGTDGMFYALLRRIAD